jgi:hypothetical protein
MLFKILIISLKSLLNKCNSFSSQSALISYVLLVIDDAAVSCLNTKVVDIHIPPREYIDTKHVFTQLLKQMHFYTN